MKQWRIKGFCHSKVWHKLRPAPAPLRPQQGRAPASRSPALPCHGSLPSEAHPQVHGPDQPGPSPMWCRMPRAGTAPVPLGSWLGLWDRPCLPGGDTRDPVRPHVPDAQPQRTTSSCSNLTIRLLKSHEYKGKLSHYVHYWIMNHPVLLHHKSYFLLCFTCFASQLW